MNLKEAFWTAVLVFVAASFAWAFARTFSSVVDDHARDMANRRADLKRRQRALADRQRARAEKEKREKPS